MEVCTQIHSVTKSDFLVDIVRSMIIEIIAENIYGDEKRAALQKTCSNKTRTSARISSRGKLAYGSSLTGHCLLRRNATLFGNVIIADMYKV